MHACTLSRFKCMRARLVASVESDSLVTPWTVARQAPLPTGFSRQEYWSGLPCPPPGDLPDPGVISVSLPSPALAGSFFIASATWEAQGWEHYGRNLMENVEHGDGSADWALEIGPAGVKVATAKASRAAMDALWACPSCDLRKPEEAGPCFLALVCRGLKTIHSNLASVRWGMTWPIIWALFLPCVGSSCSQWESKEVGRPGRRGLGLAQF